MEPGPHRVTVSDGQRAQDMDPAAAEGPEGADILGLDLAIAPTGEELGKARQPWRLWLVSGAAAIAAHGVILALPMATPEETIQLPPPAPKAAVIPLTALPTPTPTPQKAPQRKAEPAPARSPQARPSAAPSRSTAAPSRAAQRPAASPSPKPAPPENSQKPDPSPSPTPSATPSPSPSPSPSPGSTPDPNDPLDQGLDLTQNPPPSPEPDPEPEPKPDPQGLPSLPGLPVSEGGCGAGASCYGLPDNFGVHSITAQRIQDALGGQVIVRENSDLYDRTEQAREFILSHADSEEEIGYYYVISTPIAGQVGAVMLGSRDRLSTLEEIRQMALGQMPTDGE